MATITKNWEVNTLQRELKDGFVSKAIYRIKATDGTYEVKATGEVDFVKPETLVPYKDLSEATVVGWIKARIDEIAADPQRPGFSVAQIEEALDQQIAEQATPTYGVGTPWAGETPSGPPTA